MLAQISKDVRKICRDFSTLISSTYVNWISRILPLFFSTCLSKNLSYLYQFTLVLMNRPYSYDTRPVLRFIELRPHSFNMYSDLDFFIAISVFFEKHVGSQNPNQLDSVHEFRATFQGSPSSDRTSAGRSLHWTDNVYKVWLERGTLYRFYLPQSSSSLWRHMVTVWVLTNVRHINLFELYWSVWYRRRCTLCMKLYSRNDLYQRSCLLLTFVMSFAN